jgi:hypothetical protein
MSSALTRVTTDEQGYFELQRLAAIPVTISVTPDFHPGPAMGAGRPAIWEPNLEVDLSEGPDVVDIGEIVVQESRPFRISGDLVFDPQWLGQAGHGKTDLSIHIEQVAGEQLPEGVRRVPVHRQKVPIDLADGSYAFAVETPSTRIRLTFSLKGYPVLRFVVRPEALQSKTRTIHIPSDFEE